MPAAAGHVILDQQEAAGAVEAKVALVRDRLGRGAHSRDAGRDTRPIRRLR